ncbi:MAG: EAL domain-containing protein [Desulfarculaceae bacterium]|nr:EAL domain-containing protein [Desulfarculaceae bacterium]MCF8074141.1 EAL domain-containing protein [Desulfarculaceae bacterium]MCF8103267.1 EAL domain-containing protein [Desulfarculaceae bacterium]MCF8116875.1 EAL domain-containing protein [Desulfarculaceae bacterium]
MQFDQEISFSQKVLMVDDDPNILDFLRQAAQGRVELITAESAQKGLEILEQQGPFGVVMSDLRMPVMDGISFLAQARERWPHTVRILFTAFADLEAAIEAINICQVFRLLTKPAHNQDIMAAMIEGLRQHRLLVADEAHLLERERQFRTALLDLPLPTMIHAEDGQVVLVNRAWRELSGWDMEDLPDIQSWGRKALGWSAEQAWGVAAKLYDIKGSVSQGEFGVTTKQGGSRVWDFSSAPLGKMPDERRVVISIASDVTQRRAMEDSLILAGQVFDNATNGILVTDLDANILDVNPALCEISGFSREELIDQSPRLFRSGSHDADFYRAMWQALKTEGAWRGEIWNRRKNGEIYPALLTISRVGNGQQDGTGFVAITSDLSDLRQAQERTEYLSRHDDLTGLFNRTTLHEHLKQAVEFARRQGRQVVVAYLDLDQFKLVNDSLGHEVGDRALVEVARRLHKGLLETDTLVRWGADHFVFVSLTPLGQEPAELLARRLLESVEAPLDLKGQRLFLTASAGLSIHPGDAENPEELVQHADTAMHSAKQLGRNRFQFFDASMNQYVVERLTLEGELRAALEQKQFILHYQPQVELSTGRVRGLEALVRWQHPRHGLMLPDHFIPVAEEADLIVPLGNQVLHMACAQMSRWQGMGVPVERVAVNLSSRQLWEEDLLETITNLLQEYGCPPDLLELEVTESVIMSSVEKGVEVLGRLRKLGVEVSIDDFGTGYSSLYYLKKLPFNILKIDKSFVDDIPGDEDSSNIVASIAGLAHGLHKQVVVEGVETRPQLEAVHSFGCEMVQGFYFSRPLAPEDVEQLLKSGPRPFANRIPGAE